MCVHPLDVVRVNLQVDSVAVGGKKAYSGTLDCIRSIASRDGVKGLYAGLSAGILRQLTYGGPRMAIYPTLVDAAKTTNDEVLPFWKKLLCGATAGALASMTGVPSEVVLVRTAADNKLPAGDPARRNYVRGGESRTHPPTPHPPHTQTHILTPFLASSIMVLMTSEIVLLNASTNP